MRTYLGSFFATLVLAAFGGAGFAAELVVLSDANWRESALRGKEADAILGDYVLRNDKLAAAIAQPLAGRNANMTVRGVGGMIIDLAGANRNNDQLSAYYAGGGRYSFTSPEAVAIYVDGEKQPAGAKEKFTGRKIAIEFTSDAAAGRATATTRYTLEDGAGAIEIETVLRNPHGEPVREEIGDSIRADRTFEFGDDASLNLFWASDDWFRRTYGVLPIAGDGEAVRTIVRGEGRAAPVGFAADGNTEATIPPGGEVSYARKLYPAPHLLAARAAATKARGEAVRPASFTVTDPLGAVGNARIVLTRDGKPYGAGRTNNNGKLRCGLPPGDYAATVSAQGSPEVNVALRVEGASEFAITLAAPGIVEGKIRSQAGEGLPCKIAFHAAAEQVGEQAAGSAVADPNFGPESGHTSVGNLVYTASGDFQQRIAPGKYEVIVSHGPEYDAVFQTIEVRAGETTPLEATLVRTVDTTGYISADFHNHSTPSGDNTAHTLGRVQNLLAEHVEFAPCTEHNRIATYTRELRRLKAEKLMATCPGIELTGTPLPINHQNAFPLKEKPRRQDGGGPVTDENPVVQIERLALWDAGSEKLVQLNHPNLPQIFGDRDLDGNPDEGFAKMFGFMDVIEVHPPDGIFNWPTKGSASEGERNPIAHWLQLLNLGYRIPGVVNTDAHYNFHGSSWHRNFIKCSTDDPAKIDVMEMVEAAEQGRLVMSTGPFLEFTATSGEGEAEVAALPGEDLKAADKRVRLRIRVQCSNWMDVNRVQLFINGRPSPEFNFTRASIPERFSDDVVKFEAELPLALESDAHLIAATIGEGQTLGRVLGPDFGKMKPVAVSNPIFVDVDGDGFQPNGDLLDIPLPVKAKP